MVLTKKHSANRMVANYRDSKINVQIHIFTIKYRITNYRSLSITEMAGAQFDPVAHIRLKCHKDDRLASRASWLVIQNNKGGLRGAYAYAGTQATPMQSCRIGDVQATLAAHIGHDLHHLLRCPPRQH